MPGYGATQARLLAVLSDGKPRSRRELMEETGLTSKAVGSALRRLWKGGEILRTQRPTYEALRAFKGRAGIKKNTRAYHCYVFASGKESVSIQGMMFAKYDENQLDRRGSGKSKAQAIREFIVKNSDRAFYSTEIAEALKDYEVEQRDVMSTLRRAEKKGLVYIRGYRRTTARHRSRKATSLHG